MLGLQALRPLRLASTLDVHAFARESEYVDLRGDSLLALGEVLRLAGRLDAAAEAMQDGLDLSEAKGNVVFAARTRGILRELQGSSPSE